jgi:hypothetical protein
MEQIQIFHKKETILHLQMNIRKTSKIELPLFKSIFRKLKSLSQLINLKVVSLGELAAGR